MRAQGRTVEPAEIAVAREQPCKHQATAGYHGNRDSATITESL